ncbi:MAG TPA: DUF1579 family protein [Bacteroidia bacterium]|nr:DUF1579 family protein [Bacteroidia bacterium]
MKNCSIPFGGYLLIAFLVPFLSFSQTMNRPPDRMKMLSAFSGEWKGEFSELRKGKKTRTKISHISEKVAGGWAVQVSESANLPDKGKYMSVKIFSYSNAGDTTYMYIVDNLGATYFYTGTWKGNKHLDLTSNTIDEKGKALKKEVSYDFKNMREYEYKYISSIGDSVESVIEMSMKKQ